MAKATKQKQPSYTPRLYGQLEFVNPVDRLTTCNAPTLSLDGIARHAHFLTTHRHYAQDVIVGTPTIRLSFRGIYLRPRLELCTTKCINSHSRIGSTPKRTGQSDLHSLNRSKPILIKVKPSQMRALKKLKGKV